MFENVWFVAATWMALALVASLISIWTGISVALIEILVGVVAGNFLHLQTNTYWPLARLHYMRKREAAFTTLLMATGLTFGTISALFGLQNKIIDQRQYTILVTVVILSAFVPTLIAQKFFQPTLKTMRAWRRLYRRKETFRSALEAVRN
jgi:Kef-type K+ transport system membrane component KefB